MKTPPRAHNREPLLPKRTLFENIVLIITLLIALGAVTLLSTSQSRFASSALDTYIHWANPSAGDEHTAVFGGTAGTVTIAAVGAAADGLQFITINRTFQNQSLNSPGLASGIDTASGADATISSQLAGIHGFNKPGGGTLRLTGSNAYPGQTALSAGTLLIDGGHSLFTGQVSVSSGSTLGGTGSIGGVTNVAEAVSPDDPGSNNVIETVTFFNTLGFTSVSKLVFTLASPSSRDSMAGSGAGSMDLNADLLVQLDVNAYAAGATVGEVFGLIDWSGTAAGHGFDPDLDIELADGPLAGGLSFDYSSFLAKRSIVVVPEPSRALLAIASLAGIALKRRKSRPVCNSLVTRRRLPSEVFPMLFR